MFFTKPRTKILEAQTFLARLADSGTMNRVRQLEDQRSERRTALNLGVWCIPMDARAPLISQAFAALTKDLCSNGLSVITNDSIVASELLVCFSGNPVARFVRVNVRNRKELGMGWLQLGLEATELVDAGRYPELGEFAGTVVF
jgi:hypothetical protein